MKWRNGRGRSSRLSKDWAEPCARSERTVALNHEGHEGHEEKLTWVSFVYLPCSERSRRVSFVVKFSTPAKSLTKSSCHEFRIESVNRQKLVKPDRVCAWETSERRTRRVVVHPKLP